MRLFVQIRDPLAILWWIVQSIYIIGGKNLKEMSYDRV